MKAIVQDAYGSPAVLKLKDVDKPMAGDNDVLVRVHAAAINAGDYFMMRGRPFPVRVMLGMRKPKYKVPGWDLAGCVEDIGKNETRFRPGEEVFGAKKT